MLGKEIFSFCFSVKSELYSKCSKSDNVVIVFSCKNDFSFSFVTLKNVTPVGSALSFYLSIRSCNV